MIHRIEIENYGSVRDAVVIDLSVPATAPQIERFAPSRGDPNVRLPTVVAFFGPNAAGKTTVLRALASTIDFALHTFQLAPNAPIPHFQPFRSSDWKDRPTRIMIDFDASWIGTAAHIYRYKIAIAHGKRGAGERVLAESLSIRDGRRFRALFKREGQTIHCASELHLPSGDSRLKVVRPNASLISTLASLNHEFFRSVWEYIWLTQRNVIGFEIINLDVKDALIFLHEHNDALHDLRFELSRMDLGLRDVSIESSPYGLYATFTHDGLDDPVTLPEESHGTTRFVSIFPVLWFVLKTGHLAIIDEFDVNLHPMLVPELLGWFQDMAKNPHGAQLFFAAHNVAVMELFGKGRDIPCREVARWREFRHSAKGHQGSETRAEPATKIFRRRIWRRSQYRLVMPRSRRPLRSRIFMAFEGESENAFCAWLQDLCDDNGLFVHLDRPRRMKGGGDPLALVECALKLRAESLRKAGVGHGHSFLLIDSDRLDDGSQRSTKASEIAAAERLGLIVQVPCFEAVLLRLHEHHEKDCPPDAETAVRRLGRVWGGYRKPMTRQQLAAHFKLSDLQRLARTDTQVRHLMDVLGLP